MSDMIDVIYRLRNMAADTAAELRPHVRAAQAVLDRLDDFADEAEKIAELAAASRLYPTHSANIPAESGLMYAPYSPEGDDK